MIFALIKIVDILTNLLIWIILLHIILQYFLPPYHEIRQTLSKIVNPMLDPIRKFVPAVGMFDFSTMVLWIIIIFARNIIIGLLSNFIL